MAPPKIIQVLLHNCVRAKPEQPLHYWRSNRRRCHHIQEAPPSDHPRAKWFTVIESLRTNKPENQLQPVAMHQKGSCFHTLHLPDSHSPFLHPWWRCLWKTSLTFPKASLNLVIFVADLNRPPPRLGQRAKGSKAAPQRNDVEKDNAKLAILVEMELSYL